MVLTVYILELGNFNARARAKNFDLNELSKAIQYAKLRNVKVHVTLNILIKDEEFEDAVKLALTVYNLGADALIIQDLGLLTYLKNNYPEITLHASTQMTTHNLDGVKQLENMGASRVVLSRELSIDEIKNICENSNIEIETFIHGALCICYSGQCLFSSIVGGRSGNRGLCAQPCRLPYTLLDESHNELNKGYLLSPRDLFSFDYLTQLIRSGVSCFKIEGRLKNPEYVAITTRFYRKYIDLVCNNLDMPIEQLNNLLYSELSKIHDNTSMSDKEEITQIFNRGGFSSGHLSPKENTELIYREKSSNTGFYLGKVENFNPNKGYITLTAKHKIELGDKVEINSNTYTISELMQKNNNIKSANINDKIVIGRIKGNIKNNMPIYKLQSKILVDSVKNTFEENKEFKKIPLYAKINIFENTPITLEIGCNKPEYIYYNEKITITSEIKPIQAVNKPISKEKIIEQLSKTGSTQFSFDTIEVNLEDNLFIPRISILNELRREAITKLENNIINKHINSRNLTYKETSCTTTINHKSMPTQSALLLNKLNLDFDYKILTNIDKLYLPLHFFLNPTYKETVNNICNHFKTYIYMPPIIRDSTKTFKKINKITEDFTLKGAVISHISQYELFKIYTNFELIGNYTLNIYNINTINYLKKLGFSSYMISPELNDNCTQKILDISPINSELLVYGRIPLMTMNYCILGESNHCYKECQKQCNSTKKFYLKDRMNFTFRIIPDNYSTITTIYNSKITSFDYSNYNTNIARISILDEDVTNIQNIIDTIKTKKRFEGKEYCNHFNQS